MNKTYTFNSFVKILPSLKLWGNLNPFFNSIQILLFIYEHSLNYVNFLFQCDQNNSPSLKRFLLWLQFANFSFINNPASQATMEAGDTSAPSSLKEKMESFWPIKLSHLGELKFDQGFWASGENLSPIVSILRVKL